MTSRFRVATLAVLLNAPTWLGCAHTGGVAANKALVRGYMEEILNRGDTAAAERYFPSEGFTLNGVRLGPVQLAMMRQRLLAAFPDFHLVLTSVS